MFKQPGSYNNREPRKQQAQLQGWGARALSAHQNTLEAFPIFAAGMLAAMFQQGDSSMINTLGWTYLLARVGYVILYVLDWHWQRSLVWALGFGASLWLFFV